MVAKNARFRSNNDKLSLSDTAYSPHHGYHLMCSLMCLILLGSPIRLFCQQSQPAKHPQGALENHTLENRWLKVDLETSAGRLGRMRVQARCSGKRVDIAVVRPLKMRHPSTSQPGDMGVVQPLLFTERQPHPP